MCIKIQPQCRAPMESAASTKMYWKTFPSDIQKENQAYKSMGSNHSWCTAQKNYSSLHVVLTIWVGQSIVIKHESCIYVCLCTFFSATKSPRFMQFWLLAYFGPT